MSQAWEEVAHIFSKNDGSLPEIEFEVHNPNALKGIYAFIQQHSRVIETTAGAYYWSKAKGAEVPIALGDDPVTPLLADEAEPFHLVFGDIVSPSGRPVPPLGLFVFADGVTLDYRMGPDWNSDSVTGFFEILEKVAQLADAHKFDHKENLNDGGDELLTIWLRWRRSRNA